MAGTTVSRSRLQLDHRVRDPLIAAVAGALLGAAAVVVTYVSTPAITLEMDRSLPRRFASGFYDSERSGQTTFAWTAQRADIRLAGLSRRITWSCSVRLRGGRSDPATQPSVDLAADGIVATTLKATNDFRDATIVLPPRPSSGAVVTITSSSTIVPGASDPRQLGVQIDRLSCAPQNGMAWPPSATIRDAALAGAILGAVFGLVGLTPAIALAAVTVVAVLQALPLSAGPAPYMSFSQTMVWYALWIGIATVTLVVALNRLRPRELEQSARLAIVVSAGVLYLKLLGLLHPSKLIIDAVFHAHRFEWVLSGNYYFTQGMPGGVTFPYAIGLYVFALPWSVFTRDHVTLLRVIVCSAQAVAGALLYPVILKNWGDRIAAVSAVVFVSAVPLAYGLLGNANLTNTFGEAVALAAVLTASLVPNGRVLPLALFFLLCLLAFLSHVSTFALLATTLMVLAVLYRGVGGFPLRRTAWSIATVTIISAVLAVALYYGHFGAVYRDALRVRAHTAAAQPSGAASSQAAPTQITSVGSRIRDAIRFAVVTIGWPIVLLAVVGIWRSIIDGARDRASLAVIAWAIACALFLGVAVMRVDAPFQRYAAEFFGRVVLATYPAAVLLAARGAAWGWHLGRAGRIASLALVCCAVAFGIQSWMTWFY